MVGSFYKIDAEERSRNVYRVGFFGLCLDASDNSITGIEAGRAAFAQRAILMKTNIEKTSLSKSANRHGFKQASYVV